MSRNWQRLAGLIVLSISAFVATSQGLSVLANDDPLYTEDFESTAPGALPSDWLATGPNNSIAEDASQFAVAEVDGTRALASDSGASNVHAHYTGTESPGGSGYSVSGRLRFTDSASGIGVTVFSDYNNSDRYYRLRRFGYFGGFELSPHGTSITSGTTQSGVIPGTDNWYEFAIEVEDTGSETLVRASVWESGSPQPADWQIDAVDASSTRLTSGTIGAWAYLGGTKYWDDLVVEPLSTPGPYSLALTASGAGTVVSAPELPEYQHGEGVELTADPDPGWVFLRWEGDHSGSASTTSVEMTQDRDITAVFAEDTPLAISTSVTGEGALEVTPAKSSYSVGDEVTLSALPSAEWRFIGWNGDLAGSPNPATVTLEGDLATEAVFEPLPEGLFAEDFEALAVGSDPANWIDTTANNGMAEDDGLFSVVDIAGTRALGTDSTASNIHSHYTGPDSYAATDYLVTGRMRISDQAGGIGVTVLSDYPNSDRYYRLRRFGTSGSFHISPHGTAITSGETDTGVIPSANTWYRFAIEVEDTGNQTIIRASAWEDGTDQPSEWQFEAFDDSATRLSTGTVGAWSYLGGSKYWDDFDVVYTTDPTERYEVDVSQTGEGTITVSPNQPDYEAGSELSISADPADGWLFTGWSGDLTGTANPETLTVTDNHSVAATFEQEAPRTLTVSSEGQGTTTVTPDQATYDHGDEVTISATADAGWRFSGWSGDLGGTANPATLTITGDMSVVAMFAEETPLTLTVNELGQGSASVTPDQPSYVHGDDVTVSATAAEGWRFAGWTLDPAITPGWWDPEWSYRLPIEVNAAGTPRTDAIAEIDVDFTAAWAGLGMSGQFAPDSLRVVEVSDSGTIIGTDVPFQFDPAPGSDANTNAAGTLVVLLGSDTGANETRRFHVYFDDAAKGFAPAEVAPRVTLTDGVADAGLSTYRIGTGSGTYFFDKTGGGFSSLVDAAGEDWIGYNSSAGSAGTYRGIPNMVYPEGHMRPGGGQVTSTITDEGPLKVSIRSTAEGGTWATTWDIFPGHARLTVEAAGHSYWFLYEGTPGGTLDLESDIVVRADGTQTVAGDAWTGDLAGDEWVFFGDATAGRSLYLQNQQGDAHTDSYYPMEGNMTVFGFGRDGLNAYLDQAPATFHVGLVESTAHGTVGGRIASDTRPLEATTGAAQSFAGDGFVADDEITFTMTADQTVTATFVELVPLTLGVTTAGSGSVSIDPDLETYTYGDTITVTASPGAGWLFSGWSGDLSGSANPLVFTITEDTNLVATFEDPGPLTVTTSTEGSGSIALDPAQETYTYGQEITVTANAAAGWKFDSWSGDLDGPDNPASLVVDGNKNVVATFLPEDHSAPLIDVWYGDTQRYGHIGRPQPWFNILGNVSDPEGVAELSYTLNGGVAEPLSIGYDDRRLANTGDFNVDLHYLDLVEGENTVEITAVDTLGNDGSRTVTVMYDGSNVWPATYTVDWGSATSIEDVAQVVDGDWEIQGDGVRILDPDYDRLIGIGDVAWTDYEVTVPVTLHGIDNEGFTSGSSGGAAFGLLFRWNGHTDLPVSGWQPKTGWLPYGAIGWYWYSSPTHARLQLDGNMGHGLDESSSTTPPAIGGEYIFKMRVETVPDVGGLYRLKVWPAGEPEPAGWDLSGQENTSDPQNGSVLLLAHHIDATFGDVTITPLGFATTSLDVTTSGEGTVTADPDKADYSYGEAVTLTATAQPGWTFTGWDGDLSGTENPATITMDGSKSVTAIFAAENDPPVIGNVDVTAYTDSAVITWNTDKPATSEVSYGETSAYELGAVQDSALVTAHSMTLQGLTDATTYHFQVGSTDSGDRTTTTPDATFTTIDGTNPSGLLSDDFNICSLDGALWTFVDPVGDGDVRVNGTQLELTVAGGTGHDVWTGGNMAPRVMQAINDADVSMTAKFDSPVADSYEMQGFIVEQDAANFLRFDFFGHGGQTYLFAASFTSGSPTVIANTVIADPADAAYMRLDREGDTWTLAYSADGSTWTTGASFVRALDVSQAGLFAGNAGGSPPEHTAVVDFFFNSNSPIQPEDAESPSCD